MRRSLAAAPGTKRSFHAPHAPRHVDRVLTHPSGVPGEIRGLEYLSKNYGKLPWKFIVDRVAQVAEEGFTVTEDMMKYFKMAIDFRGHNFLVHDPTWAKDFAPNGTLVGVGDIMTRKRYAATLRTIADYGPDALYKGDIAKDVVDTIRSTGGNMTERDLLNYTIIRRDTSNISYRGYDLTSTTAPTSGAVSLSILKILERYEDFFQAGNEPLSTHRLNEAIRYGYGRVCNIGNRTLIHIGTDVCHRGASWVTRSSIGPTT